MTTIDLLNNHRTIRKYSNQPIDENTLNTIIEAGCRASTTGNMQLYSIIITRDPARREQLAPFHFNQPVAKQAPVTLTFCADFNRFNLWCQQRQAEPGYDNFLSFTTAAIDALLVAQNVCIAAESKGLGICYLGTTTYMSAKIIDLLKLPKGVIPITTLTLGYPNETSEKADRLPLSAILHQEYYHDYQPSDIEKLYAEKEAIEANKKFVAENNKETLAQVFTDVRYKKGDNVAFSKSLLEVLKSQGFMNQ